MIIAPSNSTKATDQKVSPVTSSIIGNSSVDIPPKRNALRTINASQAPSTWARIYRTPRIADIRRVAIMPTVINGFKLALERATTAVYIPITAKNMYNGFIPPDKIPKDSRSITMSIVPINSPSRAPQMRGDLKIVKTFSSLSHLRAKKPLREGSAHVVWTAGVTRASFLASGLVEGFFATFFGFWFAIFTSLR